MKVYIVYWGLLMENFEHTSVFTNETAAKECCDYIKTHKDAFAYFIEYHVGEHLTKLDKDYFTWALNKQ